jgi:hypothetical protein
MSRSRRNLLIVVLIVWFLVSWLLASVGPGAEWLAILQKTLQIFLPGALLLTLLVGIERAAPERHVAIIRKNILGDYDVVLERPYFVFPLLLEVVARLPAYGISFEVPVVQVETRTAKLLRILSVKVRCDYSLVPQVQQNAQDRGRRMTRQEQATAETAYLECYRRAQEFYELRTAVEQEQRLAPTDPAFWRQVMHRLVGAIVDDTLRDTVWSWPPEMDPADPRRAQPPSAKSTVSMEPENDPYVLSLNRRTLERAVLHGVRHQASPLGLRVENLVFESIDIDPELIKGKNRSRDNEVKDAQHQVTLDYIGIKGRGIAEADVRARTVRRVLEELAAQQRQAGFPALTEKTIAEIVRAAMYSDGRMIWNGVLESGRPAPPPPPPPAPPAGPAKTA